MLKKDKIQKFEDMTVAAVIDGRLSEAVLVKVSLSETEKQIYLNKGGKVEITSKGYKKLNQYAKISIVKPPNLIFKGQIKGNPYFIYKEGYLRGAIIRAMGIGYTVGGGVVISEQTVNYDVGVVFANELLRNIKDYPESGFMAADDKDIPDKVTYLVNDKENEFPTKGRKWKYYQLDPWAGGAFVDPRSPNIVQLVASHMQRLSSLSTRINTMVEKQVLRNHPAIGIHYVINPDYIPNERGKKDLIGTAEIYMWKTSLSEERILEVRQDIIDGKTFDDIRILTKHHDITEVEEEEVHDEKTEPSVIDTDTEKEMLLERIKKSADKYLFREPGKSYTQMSVDELKKIIKEVEGEDE